jgi:pimeloyl-ACP methyl ester carboxylesterase
VIAQQLALRHPEKVKSMILMCTWARQDRFGLYTWQHLMKAKADMRPEDFMQWIQMLIFTKPWFDNDDCWNNMQQGLKDAATNPAPQPLHATEAQSAAAISHNTLNELKNVKCPTLVIGGKNDTFTPRWMSEEVAAAIPGADLHLYDNAGHAFHWECLGDFNPRTTEWLLKH